MLEVFDPSIFCIWNQMSRSNQQARVLPRDFFCTNSFDDSMNSKNLISFVLISPKTVRILPKNFLNFRSDTAEKGIVNISSYNNLNSIVL